MYNKKVWGVSLDNNKKESVGNKQQKDKPIKFHRNMVWDSKIVEKVVNDIQYGIPTNDNCFFEHKIDFRASNLNFKYTKHEIDEIKKCKNDIVYFAEKYAYAMTDEGIKNIKLRGYQKKILRAFKDNQFTVLLASRQIGKTVTSGIFIAWYVTFHKDRNTYIVANKQATAIEIVSKVKTIIKHLPFFMKPGIIQNGQLGMMFDNGCRLLSGATTKTSALGFTIHLLYADEFAHIPENIAIPFYRSIYPTLSSSKISKMIITSTPNGLNLFERIYNGAVNKKNKFFPLRVDWWEVPGRDEKWKEQEIANLGSIELFEQEYGNKFIATSNSLLKNEDVEFIDRIKCEYQWKEIDLFPIELNYKDLLWHDDIDPNDIYDDLKSGVIRKFVISVDIASGIGRDYTVFNIFELEVMSDAKIRTMKLENIKNEESFFRLKQIGMFRSNNLDIEQTSNIFSKLAFDFFGFENVSIVIEMNFNGNFFLNRISQHKNFDDSCFVRTNHTAKAKFKSIGVKTQTQTKDMWIRQLSKNINMRAVIINNDKNFKELMEFAMDEKGRFRGQGKNDDIAMSNVILQAYFNSENFNYDVEDLMEIMDIKKVEVMHKKLNEIDLDDESDEYLGLIENMKKFM